ncbi:MAG: cytochrome P460 family protein [Nitrospirae bacterium]|nr:cytochrome P460 family protein [Nitrospirota bacterium]
MGIVFVAYAGHEAVLHQRTISSHMPWADAGDIRYHITIHMPYHKWDKWPGKGEMYKGREPHGSLLTTFVNKNALDSIKKVKGMADEAMIVKENYDQNKALMAITVMYKVKGYNPEGGDWFYAKYDPEFNILAEGKVKECMDCHGTVKDNDYLFTGKVTGK